MKQPIKVAIAGAAGYTGGELIRILLRHPQATIACAYSKSNAGNPINSVHRDLVGETDLVFAKTLDLEGAEVLFLCLGHGESIKYLSQLTLPPALKVIDLSQDFRLSAHDRLGERQFIYGLPELNRSAIQNANAAANPGCFATAIQLSLLPLAQTGLLSEVHVTGITGATGAGQSLQATLHFPWRDNNISAYKTLVHQHLHEIKQSLAQLKGVAPAVHFIPWRGDFPRGIFVSSCVRFDGTLQEATQLYEAFYRSHVFTHLSASAIDLKQVVNTNKCLLQLEMAEGQLVIHAIIDNLLKGASGQAVQNMNLMFGLEETAGLLLKPVNF